MEIGNGEKKCVGKKNERAAGRDMKQRSGGWNWERQRRKAAVDRWFAYACTARRVRTRAGWMLIFTQPTWLRGASRFMRDRSVSVRALPCSGIEDIRGIACTRNKPQNEARYKHATLPRFSSRNTKKPERSPPGPRLLSRARSFRDGITRWIFTARVSNTISYFSIMLVSLISNRSWFCLDIYKKR